MENENKLGNWPDFIISAQLSVRATNVLLNNFSSIDEFLLCEEKFFGQIRNCGHKTVKEIIEFRNVTIIEKGEFLKTEIRNHPRTTKEALELTPSEKNIPLLPIFSSKRVADFSWKDLHPEFHGDARLEDFVFSVRTSNAFKRLGLETIGELMLFPSREMISHKNVGRKCLKEIQNFIHSFVFAGQETQSLSAFQSDRKSRLVIDYSSYSNMIESFVRNCLTDKRNQKILCRRLDFTGDLPVLEQLGEQFGLTRERVRQILKRGNALLRVKANRLLLDDFWILIAKKIRNGGGIISLCDLAEIIKKEYDWSELPNPVALAELFDVANEDNLFSVNDDVVTTSCPCLSCETPREQLAVLDFESHESYHFLVVGDKFARACQKCCQAIPVQEFHRAFIEKLVDENHGTHQFDGDLIYLQDIWLIRHGRNLEAMIAQVFEKHGQPMHFRKVAAAIRNESIKYRNASDNSIHSAMQRYDSIDIVQRGTYGLKAWGAGGYRSVSKAIEDLLDSHGIPMRRSEIINNLLEKFSEQNISQSLHAWTNRFISIGDGFYDLPERWKERYVTDLVELLPKPLVSFVHFLTTNNNCSYKLVLAFVFIRGMDDKGAFYLPTLKERFYNFYLSRHKKGQVVEADNVLMHRIGELDATEIRNNASKEPLKSFLNSSFWNSKYSSLYLQDSLVAFLADSAVHNLTLITLLKGIDDYFTALTPQIPSISLTGITSEAQCHEYTRSELDVQEEGIVNSSIESEVTISIKKKGRGKIAL